MIKMHYLYLNSYKNLNVLTSALAGLSKIISVHPPKKNLCKIF